MSENEIIVLGVEKRRRERRNWLIVTVGLLVIVGAMAWFLSRWNYVRTHPELPLSKSGTTISPALQEVADSLLKDKMTEICAVQGQVIVMEVKTGAIKAIVGRERRFDGQLHPCENFFYQQEQGHIMMVPSLLAALETGNVNEDSYVDTGGGIYYIGERKTKKNDLYDDEFETAFSYDETYIKDHNWRRGGYGELSFEQALCYSSNIGVSRLTRKAFEGDDKWFFDKLDSMSYGKPDWIDGIDGLRPMTYLSYPNDSNWVSRRFYWHTIGYERKLAPIQMLTFYNAIANGGRMVKPTFIPDSIEVINERIASLENVRTMRGILGSVVSKGLGKKAGTGDVFVAGMPGTIPVKTVYGDCEWDVNEFNVSFCGFFPALHPRYSIIVSMNKIGLPASGGGQAGPVFGQIVNYMTEKGMVP